MSEQKHHPTITSSSGRYWVMCECGWAYGSCDTNTTAHLAFGRHLIDRAAHEALVRRVETSEGAA